MNSPGYESGITFVLDKFVGNTEMIDLVGALGQLGFYTFNLAVIEPAVADSGCLASGSNLDLLSRSRIPSAVAVFGC